MHIYIYIYIYIYAYIYRSRQSRARLGCCTPIKGDAYVQIWLSIYLYIYTYIHIYAYIHIYTHISTGAAKLELGQGAAHVKGDISSGSANKACSG